ASLLFLSRLKELPNHRGDYMRSPRIEVVSRAIKIDWQQVNSIESVLLSVGLTLYEEHLLGDSIGSIRFFRITIPEIGLSERNRGVLGICTDSTNDHHLAHPNSPAGLKKVYTHRGVVIEEFPRLGAIGPDSADDCRQMKNYIGLSGVKRLAGAFHCAEIELR